MHRRTANWCRATMSVQHFLDFGGARNGDKVAVAVSQGFGRIEKSSLRNRGYGSGEISSKKHELSFLDNTQLVASLA